MNRWRTFMAAIGISHLILWGFVCSQFVQTALTEDPEVRIQPIQWLVFGPLAAHVLYIAAPLAGAGHRFSFLVGTPLHIPMVGFLFLSVRYSLWPLLLLVAPICWILYMRALARSERAASPPA